MNNILIIAHDYYPYHPDTGSYMRVLTLANYLVEKGYKVFILSGKGTKFKNKPLDQNINIKNIYIINPVLFLYHFLKYKLKLFNYKSKDPNDRKIYNFQKIDISLFWLPFLIIRLISLIKKLDINTLIFSGPPFGTFLLVPRTKIMFPKLKVIVEYRDGWNTSGMFAKHMLFPNKMVMYEKEALYYADNVVCVTESIKNNLINKYSFLKKEKIYLIRNGFGGDEKLFCKIRNIDIREGKKFVIGYFGTISDNKKSYRSPINFFKAILDLPDKYKNMIEIRFYGNCEIKNRYNLNIKIFPPLPYKEALIEMRKCHILLVLHSMKDGAEEVIPGKIYDYIFAGRPIFCVGPNALKEAFKIVEETNCGKIARIENISEIKNVLLEFIKGKRSNNMNNFSSKYEVIIKYSRYEQYKKYLEVLK